MIDDRLADIIQKNTKYEHRSFETILAFVVDNPSNKKEYIYCNDCNPDLFYEVFYKLDGEYRIIRFANPQCGDFADLPSYDVMTDHTRAWQNADYKHYQVQQVMKKNNIVDPNKVIIDNKNRRVLFKK